MSAPIKSAEIASSKKISNIDSIRKKILEEESRNADSRKNLNLETLKTIWYDYMTNNPSMSVQLALKNTDIHLKNTTITVYVPNSVSKDLISQEINLLERLRTELGTPELSLFLEIDKLRFPEFEEVKPQMALTQKERYLEMLVKNENLSDFVQKMGLKLDSEIH